MARWHIANNLLALLVAATVVQADCNGDNLLRLLRGSAHSAEATPFCSTYICATPVTTTSYYVSQLLLHNLPHANTSIRQP